MAPKLKKRGALVIYAATAVAVPIVAWLGKGTEYENVFFYVLAAGLALAGIWEVYYRVKAKDK